MDLWAEANANQNENDEPSRYSSNNRRYENQERTQNGRDFSNRGTMENGAAGKRIKKTQERSQKEYDPRARPNPNHRSKISCEDQSRNTARRSGANEQIEQNRREAAKRAKEQEETEEDEIELEEEEDDTYGTGMDYQKFEGKKYYTDRMENQDRRDSRRNYRQTQQEEPKYENEKTSSTSTSETDDESTITIPETGRKVEHIAQKLEQTAQKYAREHSPPKFIERRTDYKSLERNREEKQPSMNYDRYNDRESRRMPQRYEREKDRYYEKSPTTTQKSSSYERERTFEKNPDRNRNVERASSRRFERPRPPSEEAPERPTEASRNFFRERRYSDKEEAIYGETSRFVREPVSIDKERGYESNFETKLERTKVIERHGYQNVFEQTNLQKSQRNGPRSLERNDTNNNTLKDDRKPLLPRQTTAVGHLIQTGRAFDVETKSPKLVKRTKSFWRFRRDSDVLEGMALWQHRSLVDIPKMVKKEARDDKVDSEDSKNQSPESSPNSRQSLEKRDSDVTITNEQIRPDEPKPAERIHVPEKSDYFEDFPTPAERPKAIERSEYRILQEERSCFVGNVSRKAIIEKERKRSLEAKRNMIVAELKENNEAKRNERRKKAYGDEEDGLIQNFSETEASDEESTYSCIVVKDQTVAEKTLLPRTKLRRDSDREKNTCGPWYDLWGVDASVNKKKKKKQQ